jgi:hypothetical protein
MPKSVEQLTPRERHAGLLPAIVCASTAFWPTLAADTAATSVLTVTPHGSPLVRPAMTSSRPRSEEDHPYVPQRPGQGELSDR